MTWEFAAPYFSVFHILFTLRTRLIVLVGKGRLRSAEKWQFLLLFPHSDAPNGTYMVMAPQITSPLNISPVFAPLTFFCLQISTEIVAKLQCCELFVRERGLYIYNLMLSCLSRMSEWSFCESARQSEISIPEQFCTFAQFFTLIPALSCFHSPPPLVSASPVVLIWLPKEPRRGVVLGQQFCLYSEGRATRWYQNTRHFCPKFPTKIYLSDIKWHFFELRIKLSAPFETCLLCVGSNLNSHIHSSSIQHFINTKYGNRAQSVNKNFTLL